MSAHLRKSFSCTLLFLLIGGLWPRPSQASLGGDATTVEADRAKMEASLQRTSNDRFAVHEMHTQNNVVVREFVSPAGKVFGVVWEGPVRPDLKQLLGPYFDQFIQDAKAQRAQRPGRGPLVVRTAGYVVEMGGHAMAFVGRAYLPPMVPANVHAEEIQ